MEREKFVRGTPSANIGEITEKIYSVMNEEEKIQWLNELIFKIKALPVDNEFKEALLSTIDNHKENTNNHTR